MSIIVRLVQGITRTTPLATFAAKQPVRYLRGNCADEGGPKTPTILPCYQDVQNELLSQAAKKVKRKSMWDNPDCCNDPCADIIGPMDEKHYRPSNKLTRKYTRTWVECPEIKIRPKKVCCFENMKDPPFERRPRKPRKQMCIPQSTDLMPCTTVRDNRCIKIKMPGCCNVRDPPKCKRERALSGCLKTCTPYPSFSECQRPGPKPLHPHECSCLEIPSMCEVWRNWRRKMRMKK